MTANSDEYRVQWTGSREGWPTPFVHVVAGLILNHIRCRNHAGDDVKLIMAHGGAKGVDQTIGTFAEGFGIETRTWLPDWQANGKRAGILRNETMIDAFDPTIGIGLNWNGSKGTDHAVSYMRSKGIPLLSITYENDPEGGVFPL